MKIIVQKFGGTSVSSAEKRVKVVEHIKNAKEDDYNVVVVVSAMGRSPEPYATDSLLNLINDPKDLNAREKDLLLSCGETISAVVLSSLLNKVGIENCVFTGSQAGIYTDKNHNSAKVINIDIANILSNLKKKKVVIVTGFQGKTLDGEVTTLGRGGSDITATALGAYLSAEFVDIFTDVKGIMTADPNIVEDAKQLKQLTYNEVCNLAFQGAKVIHPFAVEFAMKENIPVRIRHTMSDNPGTLITGSIADTNVNYRQITSVTQMSGINQVKIKIDKTTTELHLQVFDAMASNGISVDFISINPGEIMYTVMDQALQKTEEVLEKMGLEYDIRTRCAKVSVVGAGISGVPGVIASIVEALIVEKIQILQSADSYTTIWTLVHEKDMNNAVRALHKKFTLHKLEEVK